MIVGGGSSPLSLLFEPEPSHSSIHPVSTNRPNELTVRHPLSVGECVCVFFLLLSLPFIKPVLNVRRPSHVVSPPHSGRQETCVIYPSAVGEEEHKRLQGYEDYTKSVTVSSAI